MFRFQDDKGYERSYNARNAVERGVPAQDIMQP